MSQKISTLRFRILDLGYERVSRCIYFRYLWDAFDALLGVLEGFNTQHLPTFTVPATPFPSPVKLTNRQTTPTPIFRSANDALNSVFPPDSLRVLLTPSPKKRPRAEFDYNEEESLQIQDKDKDVDMDAGPEIEEDQLRSAAPFTRPRKIKPLRRSMTQSRTGDTFSDPFISTSQDIASTPFQDVAQSGVLEMNLSEEANV